MVASILLMSAMAGAPAADSAPDNQAAAVSETILVTGERAPRTLRNTPSSVVVFSERDIKAAGSDRLDEILERVPNVQMGSGEEGPAIRGQDSTGLLRNLFAFLGGTRPRVTVQVDGRPITYYEYVGSSAPLWDVARVEVFRSPQTTTQGRNSIAGAIFIETNDPGYEWQGKARALAGTFDTRQASVAVSGPIITDQLAIGLSGDVRLSRMASDMADGIPGADIDRDDYGVLRLKSLIEPASLPGLRIEATYAHTRSQAPQFEAARAPFRARRFPTPEPTNGVHRIKVHSATSQASYDHSERMTSMLTVSYGDADIRRFGLPGLGSTRVASRDLSAEAIARWQSDRLSLIGGVHHLRTHQDQSIDITGLRIGSGGFADRQRSLGVFGEARWRPADKISLTAGLRYQTDRQQRDGLVGEPATGILLAYDGRFDSWLPKFALQYDVSPSLSTGILIQRSYNPGGTSVSLARRAADSFGAERLWNYEGFVRASFANGKGTLSANLFRNTITDAQRTQYVPIGVGATGTLYSTEFVNVPRARTTGLEAELSLRAGTRLTMRAGIGLLRTRVIETAVVNDATLGNEFQRAPRLSAAGAIDWRPIAPVRLSAQVRHHSSYFSDDLNSPDRRIEPGTIVDLRGEYTHGPLTVFGYARNALNSFTLRYLFSATFATPNDPRELGVGIETRF